MSQPHDELDAIERAVDAAFDAVHDDNELRNVQARFLGREGSLTQIMKRMPELAASEKKAFGQRVNAVKQRVEAARDRAQERLVRDARERELAVPPVDATLPGRRPRLGRVHPLMRVMNELVDVFVSLGFDVAEGPEVEYAEFNFDRLGFPPGHPALDMHDTFYVDTGVPAKRPLLRTHTSPVQIREMLSHRPAGPVMVVAPGVVYRSDDDVTHSPQFMQLEGLVVDRGVTMAHLKGVLDAFVHRMFGREIPTRFRASYFPFTEPSAEMDMGCLVCNRVQPAMASCRVCKGEGWIEILGCGMVHPTVLRNVEYDPEVYTGFAFGLGIDRITMLRYGINDIRLLYENDVRFLESF